MYNEEVLKYLCETVPEAVLFAILETITTEINAMGIRLGNATSEERSKLLAGQATLKRHFVFVASYSARFGVHKSVKDDGTLTSEFHHWYYWWQSYILQLPHREFGFFGKDVNDTIGALKILKKWRPAGDWRKEPEEKEAQ